MRKEYLKAYASAVTANGMFKAVSEIPLHSSFQSYDAIGTIFSNVTKTSNEDVMINNKIIKHRDIISQASFMGQRLTEELALAFESEKVLELDAVKTIKKQFLTIFQTFDKEELEDIIKLAEVIKNEMK